MTKLKCVSVVFMAILLLGGCYESDIPLFEPSLQIDKRLTKSWISVPKDSKNKALSLVVRKFNEREYLAAWKDGHDGATVMARGFVTKINNVAIMNLQGIASLNKNDRTFLFFKYDFNKDGRLVINMLSGDYPKLKDKKFKSPARFRKFIKKNIDQEGLFDTNIEFKPADDIRFEIKP